jgi:hypothetical protein
MLFPNAAKCLASLNYPQTQAKVPYEFCEDPTIEAALPPLHATMREVRPLSQQDSSWDRVCSHNKARSHACILPLNLSVRARDMTISSVTEGILLILLMQSQGSGRRLLAPVKVKPASLPAPEG